MHLDPGGTDVPHPRVVSLGIHENFYTPLLKIFHPGIIVINMVSQMVDALALAVKEPLMRAIPEGFYQFQLDST